MQREYKEKYITAMRAYFGIDTKRIHHALKVLAYAEKIMASVNLTEQQQQIITVTAILHDIGIKLAEQKYGSSAPRYQELEGPGVAEEIMRKYQETEQVIKRVCYIIGAHHTASKKDGLDFQIIWEADLLVNIEEEGWIADKPKVQNIIKQQFKTAAGTHLAYHAYCE